MNQAQYNQLFPFIWNIANDVLVQIFTKGDFKKIILPMMVLRRLDILLEPTHTEVLKQKEMLSLVEAVPSQHAIAFAKWLITGEDQIDSKSREQATNY